MKDRLVIKGARRHNLRDISVELPRNALIAFTGVKGSGRSSLAFDTISTEGRRRYVESLSVYARQLLGQLDKPDVEVVCVGLEALEPRLFSVNAPWGACPECTGLGSRTEVDPGLVVPDEAKSLPEGAVAPWTNTSGVNCPPPRGRWCRTGSGSRSTSPARFLLDIEPGAGAHGGHVVHSGTTRTPRPSDLPHRLPSVRPTADTAARDTQAPHGGARDHRCRADRDIYVPCEVCHGAQYNRETLDVHFKGRSIADVLGMTIEDSLDFFAEHAIISRHLRTLHDVGLGHVKLGQPATMLSGGEAQRVKLAAELQKRTKRRTLHVLDEPTTGLHVDDVRQLQAVLHRLDDQGNTVVVIEHDLDVIKTADWIVDMGPEGGHRGGTVIAEGTPEQVAAQPRSYTGQFLRPLLERS